MKKLYTSVIVALILALSSSVSFAQSDLQIFRYIANASAGQQLHLMTSSDTIIINPTTPVKYAFAWLIVNHGPTHLVASDTVIFLNVFEQQYQGRYGITNDTAVFGIDTFNFNPALTTGLYKGNCDSVWGLHSGNTVISDPNPANNEYCTDIYVLAYKTAVAEVSNNRTGDLTIYPNPATSNVNFNYDFSGASKATLIISDVVGRTVYQEEITGLSGKKNVTVNVNAFVPGLYVATLVVDDARIVGKFNVQK